MIKKYQIELTEDQLRLISMACDTVSRLGIGQWREIMYHLPLAKIDNYEEYHSTLRLIDNLLSKYMIDNVDGYSSNIGIYNAKEYSRALYDIHQVIRNKLAWDKAKLMGITDGHTRNHGLMITVDYDEPIKTSDHDFIAVKSIGEEQ